VLLVLVAVGKRSPRALGVAYPLWELQISQSRSWNSISCSFVWVMLPKIRTDGKCIAGLLMHRVPQLNAKTRVPCGNEVVLGCEFAPRWRKEEIGSPPISEIVVAGLIWKQQDITPVLIEGGSCKPSRLSGTLAINQIPTLS
jgi:hypothetical protein